MVYHDDGSHFDYYSYLESKNKVSFDKYVLELSTCNVSWNYILQSIEQEKTEYVEKVRTGVYDSLMTPAYRYMSFNNISPVDKSDREIERKISQYYGVDTRSAMTKIDYRTTPIKDLKITSSVKIGNVKAGDSLNDLLEVYGYSENHSFIITANKDLIVGRDNITQISIDQYLSYHPMAPAAMKLKFRDGVKIDEPVDACFQIELTTDDGRVLKAESRHITLVP